MPLIKILAVGDEMLFEIEGKSVSIVYKEKAGSQAIMKITADRSIGITTVTKNKVHVGISA